MSKYYSINEFSKILGVSAQTLRNWDNNGKLHPHHTSSNGYRYYSHEQLNQVMNIKPNLNRIVIGYCRVSSNKQKDDLERQIENMKLYLTAQGKPFEIISDIGSGINYKKKGLKELIKRISQNKVEKVVVLYKDRLLRFGFELVEYIASLYNCDIEIIDNTEKYAWLNNISNNVTKQAIKNACEAYRDFFKGYTKFPRFKSKKKSVPSFYQDTIKIQFTNTHVKVEGFATSKKKNKQKLNWIRLAERGRIPTDCKYMNPRIKYDGLNWYITVGIEYEDSTTLPLNEGIGIDLGIKDLAICSDEHKYQNINKTQRIKKLEKRKRKLQRFIVRRHIVGGANRTLISALSPLRLCRIGTCRKLQTE